MMGNDFVMEVTGLIELQTKLLKISSPDSIKRAITPAMDEVTEEAARRLRARAPRSQKPQKPSKKKAQPWRDGKHAAEKINVEPLKMDRKGELLQFAGIRADDNSPGFYLKFHEFGTTQMDARPFARPTYMEMRLPYIRRMTEAYQELLEELEE